MRAFRLLLGDRLTAAAAVALLAQLMLLQGLVAGKSCLDMAFGGVPAVLCSGVAVPADAAVDRGERSDGNSGHCPDCACATLCGSGRPVVMAMTPETAPAFDRSASIALPRPVAARVVRRRTIPGGLMRQRGPPSLSA
ncbi:hypothetical protein [Jiella sonneratiae]|uniref:DUF2946 domain-containing protein n=1 Tax=Jiella sonneratiae TaxID=2816856 RepID=A0ABS3J8I6_9HYPH|nr:hypothetical protein [Jiella sonneratiae]MBO0905985.1 hypothetical protein [Jiella sonneratiae]